MAKSNAVVRVTVEKDVLNNFVFWLAMAAMSTGLFFLGRDLWVHDPNPVGTIGMLLPKVLVEAAIIILGVILAARVIHPNRPKG